MTPEQLAQLLKDNPDLRAANAPVRPASRPQESIVILPYPPSVNHYWVAGRGGARVLSPEAKRYKAAVAAQCAVAGMTPHTGPVSLLIRVYRPRRRGDLDNTLKALGDSLIGYAYADDEQVTEIHAVRRDDKNNPRVEVEIVRL